jgi:IS5 family transposase
MNILDRYFRPEAPEIQNATAEHRAFKGLLEMVDDLLLTTGAEKRLIDAATEKARGKAKYKRPGWLDRLIVLTGFQIRCTILRKLLAINYRKFSVIVTGNLLFQWFLRMGQLEAFVGNLDGKHLSKSSLERYDKIVPAEMLEKIIRAICAKVSKDDWPLINPAYREPIQLKDLFADCTVLEANIHFPVDWLLLRDAVRSLVSAIIVIRQHGLRHRIKDPKKFLAEINGLCMKMAAVARKKEGKKLKKKVLREMIAVATCVGNHATRYRDILQRDWQARTELSEGEANQVLARLDAIIDQLPAAIDQARERIISEKKIPNSEKILSLYENDVHIVFRGKAGAAIEYGNTLFIAENRYGMIVDYKLFKDSAPADCDMVQDCVSRMKDAGIKIESFTTDRGFSSADNVEYLKTEHIANHILPKSPAKMREAMEDQEMRSDQKRRAQTEGRIGILKNCFLDRGVSAKGFENQLLEVGWSILAHNLWVLARIAIAEKKAALSKDRCENAA